MIPISICEGLSKSFKSLNKPHRYTTIIIRSPQSSSTYAYSVSQQKILSNHFGTVLSGFSIVTLPISGVVK